MASDSLAPAFAALAPPDELFRDLLAVSLTGVILYAPIYDGAGEIVDFTFVYLNPVAQRMMRMPERPTLTHMQQWPHSKEHGTLDFHIEAFVTGEPRRYDVNYQADGYDNYYCLAARRSGQGLLVSFTDTADQPRTAVEVALRESQAAEKVARAEAEAQRNRLHSLVVQVPALIASLTGPDYLVELANDGFQQLFGGREMVGRPYREAAPELRDQGFFALLDEVYRTGETYYGKEQLAYIDQTNSGQLEPVYVNFIYQAIRDAAGAVTGILIFAYDVTEQVLARQQVQQLNQELEARVQERTRQLAAQQDQLRAIFDQAPLAIYVLRGPGHVMQIINPPMADLLGRPPAAMLGKPYFDAVPELAGQGYPELLAEVWRTGRPHVAQELPARLARHQPGETGYFTFVYQPMHDAQGQLTDIMCVAADITDQVLARQQVQALNEELAASNGALHSTNGELGAAIAQLTRTNTDLDNFIYTASHDLKAPISNIEGLLHTLRDELPAPGPGGEVPYILDLMQDSVNRFTRTIEHLTDVSKLQKEHSQPAHPVPLAAGIEDVRLDLAPLLQQTGGRLTVDVRAVPTVFFSEKNLRSVVYNLLSNALKYCHPDRVPEVRMQGRVEPDCHVLEVHDNGLGLDLTREQDLFGLFRRYHTHVAGSGIGLYMVKRMVENAGGRIEVRSEVGRGTTFTVYFKR